MSTEVKIVEVGPRDGLQNEKKTLQVSDRIELIKRLIDAGLKYLEGGSFVSPKAIPQLVDSEEVWKALQPALKVDLSFLVASENGFKRAKEAHVRSIAVFTATSESFNQKNIRKSVDESLLLFSRIVEEAKSLNMRVRAYVSTVFGCPYEGYQKEERGVEVVERLFKMGCDEVSVGDTIGVAHPGQIRSFFRKLKSQVDLSRVAAHLHDTRGMAAANILAACEEGVRIFDSSVGGLGGCPYAQGSSGNVATEEVVYLLEGIGFKTGISIPELLSTAAWVEKKLERTLKSKLYLSAPQKIFFDRPEGQE